MTMDWTMDECDPGSRGKTYLRKGANELDGQQGQERWFEEHGGQAEDGQRQQMQMQMARWSIGP
jgi:hypothetical protein